MNRMWLVGVVAVLLAGCAGDLQVGQGSVTEVSPPADLAAGGGDVSAACIALMEFEGRSYEPQTVNSAPQPGEQLGSGVFPPCNDTSGASETPETVEVRAIEGVDPERAVLVTVSPEDTVWVRSGEQLPKALQD